MSHASLFADLNARYLGKTFACECGKTHVIPTREIVYAPGALTRLPEVLARHVSGRRVALFADTRTRAEAGAEAEARLVAAGWLVSPVLISDSVHTVAERTGPARVEKRPVSPASGADADSARHSESVTGNGPACDDVTQAALRRRLPPADILLAVGSGVVCDLVKWLACDTRTPYAAVATASSMNGYASNNIAPAIRGVKRVLDGTTPVALLADPAVLDHAPNELTAAGLGDVLAKPVSIADWKLNQLLFGDYYCSVCAQLIRDIEPGYFEHPEAIRARRPDAMASLFYALVYSGVAMTMAGTSAPASGGEHMMSHVLDMTAGVQGVAHDLHGRQVGVGAVFACALYERLLPLASPRFRLVTEPTDAVYWGPLTPVVEEEHARKRMRAERATARLNEPGVWIDVRATLAPMTRPAAAIKDCLRRAGAAHRLADIGCTRDRFLAAVAHSHQIRERYTVLDLARAAGVLPGAAADIVEAYLD